MARRVFFSFHFTNDFWRTQQVRSRPSTVGMNPFSKVTFTGTTRTLAEVAPLKVPSGADSKSVYGSIANNIEAWIEEAIRIRANS